MVSMEEIETEMHPLMDSILKEAIEYHESIPLSINNPLQICKYDGSRMSLEIALANTSNNVLLREYVLPVIRRQVQRSLVSIFDDEKLYSINMIIIKHCSNSLLFIENENCDLLPTK